MNETHTPDVKAPRAGWKQSDILILAREFEFGGLPGAVRAFPTRQVEDLERKLEALGLYALTEKQKGAIEATVFNAKTETNHALYMKTLIKQLRGA